MRIHYVFTSAGVKAGSVQRKVMNQIAALNRVGVDCKGLFFTTDDYQDDYLNENIRFVKVNRVRKGWFRSARQRTEYHKTVFNFMKAMSEGTDLVYYRYPGAHRLLYRLTRILPNKIFFEHVTKESEEIKNYRKENAVQWSVSSILSQIEFYFLPLWREKIFGPFIRRNALFGICNSEDIAQYETGLSFGEYKTIVLGDAVNVSDFSPQPLPDYDRVLNMVFLKGAVTGAEFNGLDRVFKGIQAYKGETELNLYLYGSNLNAELNLIRKLGLEDRVKTSGFIDRQQADAVFKQMHLGIGALAVHRKGIKSTTTIKGREYFARGIPFIFAHHDIDISESEEGMRFCLQLPSDDHPIDFEKVILWYTQLRRSDRIPERMHAFAENKLDYNIKMKVLANYLTDIRKITC